MRHASFPSYLFALFSIDTHCETDSSAAQPLYARNVAAHTCKIGERRNLLDGRFGYNDEIHYSIYLCQIEGPTDIAKEWAINEGQ